MAPTIEHHDGHSRTLQTRGETRCPGGVSVSCLASRTQEHLGMQLASQSLFPSQIQKTECSSIYASCTLRVTTMTINIQTFTFHPCTRPVLFSTANVNPWFAPCHGLFLLTIEWLLNLSSLDMLIILSGFDGFNLPCHDFFSLMT